MKVKVQIVELSHDDIVTILSDAFYGNSSMELHYNKEDYKAIPEDKRTKDDEFKFGVSLEDKCADILENGGEIIVVDNNAEGEVYGNLSHEMIYDGSVAYQMNLQDLIKGMQCDDAQSSVQDLMDESDDFYTGYNIIQCALFGEIIYG